MKRSGTTAALLGAALAISSLSLASCGKKPEAAAPAETVFAVSALPAARGDISEYLRLSGDLVAASSVDAYSDAAGKVTKLYVGLGARVAKDQPLAEVDPSRPGMNYVASVVKAPIAGTIVALPAEVGGTVAPSVPIARISRTDALELRTYVAERFVPRMRTGLSAEVELVAVPGRSFPARVRELNPVIDPASRTMELRLSVEDEAGVLKSGMFAAVRIFTAAAKGAIVVPAEAVVRRQGESIVYTVLPGAEEPEKRVAHKVLVKTGLESDGRVEILEGIAQGDLVVVKGQTLLDEGVRVNVVGAPAAPAAPAPAAPAPNQ